MVVNKNGILFISLIAVFAVCSADADIASKAWVESQIPTVPTDVSAFDNDAGYLVDTDLTDVVNAVNAVVDDTIPESLINRVATLENAGYLTEHQDISGKQDKITSTNKLPAANVSGLATVATSGSCSNKCQCVY